MGRGSLDDKGMQGVPLAAEDVLSTIFTLVALLILSPLIVLLAVIAVYRHYRVDAFLSVIHAAQTFAFISWQYPFLTWWQVMGVQASRWVLPRSRRDKDV